MSFDQDGDAGTAAATEAALIQIAEGEGQAVIDMLDNAPPGPIETKWGVGFRRYSECLEHIRANNIEAPEGGIALPLRYTPTYFAIIRRRICFFTLTLHSVSRTKRATTALHADGFRLSGPVAGLFASPMLWRLCLSIGLGHYN